MISIGYCLWCGSEVTIAAYDIRTQQVEWEKCRSFFPCLGGIHTVITDMQGFVIHPYHRRGRYIFSRIKSADIEWLKKSVPHQ